MSLRQCTTCELTSDDIAGDRPGICLMRARILDLRGFLCPVPVHETRRAMLEEGPGVALEIICDDPETLHDIPALCDRIGATIVGIDEEDGEFTFTIVRKRE